MGTANVDNAASVAAEQSGLPKSVTETLIRLEGPSQSAPNNPFDVTKTWADLAGFGKFVTGLFNSVGVANFSSELPAIQAWAYGLLHFSNYSGTRQVMSSSTSTVQDFFDALGKTGYAGDDATYASKLSTTYRQITGLNPALTKLLATTANPTAPPITIPDPIQIKPPAVTIPAPAIANPITDALKPITNLTSAIAGIPQTIADAVRSIERFFWIVIGIIIIIAGLVLMIESSKEVRDVERTAATVAA